LRAGRFGCVPPRKRSAAFLAALACLARTMDRKEEGQPVFARRRRGAERLSQGGGAGGFLGGEFQHSIFNKKYSMGNGIL
jgi:hypothetical protein